MSQQQILDVLAKHKEPMTAVEIASKLNINHSAVNKALNAMIKHREINHQVIMTPYHFKPISHYTIKK